MKWKFYIGCFFLSQNLHSIIVKKFFLIKQYRSEWNRYDPLHQFEVQTTVISLSFSHKHSHPLCVSLLKLPLLLLICPRTLGSFRLLPNRTLSPVNSRPIFGWFSRVAATQDGCESGGVLPLKIHTLDKVPRVPVSFPSNVHIHLTHKGPNMAIQAGTKDSNPRGTP